MDIQQGQNEDKKQANQIEKKQNLSLVHNQQERQSIGNGIDSNNRSSMQGRPSNQSFMSFGRMSIQEAPFYENQKISLQSDISSKAREKFENGDLFQNLANEQSSSFGNNMFLREQGSYKQYRISEQQIENNPNFQVHFPIQSNFYAQNNQGMNQLGLNFSSQQFKQRNSQGTNPTPIQLYAGHNHFLHNQSQQTIKVGHLQSQIQKSEIKPSELRYSDPYKQNQINKQGQEKQKVISCKCPRSKCLLMYCECFSKGIMCNSQCSCYQCRNNPDFQEKRQNARRIVLQRDANAFSNKLEVVGGQQSSQLAYKRGCNCKKTNCFKKYCECFYAGVKCTYLCKCQNCMNGGQNAYKG